MSNNKSFLEMVNGVFRSERLLPVETPINDYLRNRDALALWLTRGVKEETARFSYTAPVPLPYPIEEEAEEEPENVKCEHCGQWGKARTTCKHCGAAID